MKRIAVWLLAGLMTAPVFAQHMDLKQNTQPHVQMNQEMQRLGDSHSSLAFETAYQQFVKKVVNYQKEQKTFLDELNNDKYRESVAPVLLEMADAYLRLPPSQFVMGYTHFGGEWEIGGESMSQVAVLTQSAALLPEQDQETYAEFLQLVKYDIRLYNED